MSLLFVPYVIIDGHKYAVAQGTYLRKWTRAFSSQLAGNIVRLNFVDRGPGIRVYDFTLMIQTWAPGSLPFTSGITATYDAQLATLEASYAKVATPIQFVDPLGQSPGAGGVYFTNLTQIFPNQSTPEKPYLLYEVELTEATQVVA